MMASSWRGGRNTSPVVVNRIPSGASPSFVDEIARQSNKRIGTVPPNKREILSAIKVGAVFESGRRVMIVGFSKKASLLNATIG